MLEIVKNPERRQWDTYVTSHKEGAFSHLYGWAEALSRAYDLPVVRLAAVESLTNRLRGVLPLLDFSFADSASRLISLPYTDGAGLLTNSSRVATLLLAAAYELAEKRRVHHLELRQQGERFDTCIASLGTAVPHASYVRHSFKTGLVRPLPVSSDTLWRSLPPKVRNQVRKARKERCTVEHGGQELLDRFYMVFSENMRDLGSPVHHFKLFSTVAAELCDQFHIFIVSIGELPVAAAMVFHCGTTLFNPWASSLRRVRPQCPNMLLYWSMLSFGCDYGYRMFDFGRSTPNAPTYRFKKQWGAMPVPLSWHVLSLQESVWDPRSETLEYQWWKTLSVKESVRLGPEKRKRISL